MKMKRTNYFGKRPARQTRSLGCKTELLEGRRLLSVSGSVTFNSSTGILSITGDPTTGCQLTAYLSSNGTAVNGSADNGHLGSEALSSVKGIDITGGSGGDYVYVDTALTVPVTINSGAGNDTIRGGGGHNTIIAGDGNDWIDALGDGDSVTAGNGNDTVLGGNGNDYIDAGNGNDSLVGSNGNDTIICGNGNDSLEGDSGNDSLVAGSGHDTLAGGLGNDTLVAGTGTDTLEPDSGSNELIVNSTGKYSIVPTAGTYTLVNGSGQSVTPPPPSYPTPQTTTWITFSAAQPATSTSPQAVMQLLYAEPMVGVAVDTQAINSKFGSGSPITSNIQWNFGDSSSKYNQLPGFNASHIYNTAGTYTITLTVTNNLGLTSSISTQLTITADTRKVIYVDSVNGKDTNSGASASLAVQTTAEADKLMGNNTEILFDRGETFNMTATFLTPYTNVLVGAYGSGANPVLNWNSSSNGDVMVSNSAGLSDGITFENLTFQTLNGTTPGSANLPMAIVARSTDIAVLNCTFDDVMYDVNANGEPLGLTIQGCTSPLTNGTYGYFLWGQGSDLVALGNTDVNSLHEHILRTSDASEVLAYGNNFTNNDGKGGIEIHQGDYAWIADNTVTNSDIRVGPLGLWNEPATSNNTDDVIEANVVNNNCIAVDPGSHSVSIRNNVILRNSAMMININSTDSAGRIDQDIEIVNNTGIDTGTTGNFLKVQSHTDGIILDNNLMVAPSLQPGSNNTAPVFVNEANLSSFTQITGNIWPAAVPLAYADGGINFVGTDYVTAGYLTPAVWNAESVVGTDLFSNVTINSSTYAPSSSSVAASADSPVAGVFLDFTGATRPTSGHWTAGAVQV